MLAFLTIILLQSCSAEEPIPARGENSFVARLDGKVFVAEDMIHFPSGTKHGLLTFVRNNSWRLTVTNSSRMILYINIYDVDGPGNYLIKEGNRNIICPDPAETPTSVVVRNSSLDLLYVTNLPNENEIIKITEVQGDSIIIGEFKEIRLINPEDPQDEVFLTEGKFNINRATLNENDF